MFQQAGKARPIFDLVSTKRPVLQSLFYGYLCIVPFESNYHIIMLCSGFAHLQAVFCYFGPIEDTRHASMIGQQPSKAWQKIRFFHQPTDDFIEMMFQKRERCIIGCRVRGHEFFLRLFQCVYFSRACWFYS